MSTDKDQQLAIKMFSQGKTMNNVIEMLKQENQDQALSESLALKYKRDFDGLRRQERRELEKSVKTDQLIGGLSLSTGILVTLASYLFMDNVYFIFYGLIVCGLFFLGRSLVKQRSLDAIEEDPLE